MKKLTAIVLLAGGLAAASAQEIFRLTPNAISGLSYNAQSDNPVAVAILVRIRQPLDYDYVYALSFEPGSTSRRLVGPDPAFTLPYNLLDTSVQPPRILKAWMDGIYPGDFPTAWFPAGARNTNNEHPFSVIFPAGAIVPAGTYTGSFSVNLHGGPQGVPPVLASTRSFPLSVVVPEFTELGLVQPGFPFHSSTRSQTLDFGQLQEGDSRSLDLIVRSNVRYSVSVSSTNGSVLRNTNPAETSPIPYRLSANGTAFSMPAGLAIPIVSQAPWTAGGEARYRLDFGIGAFGMVSAGEYSDTLIFTVAAN